MEVCSKMERVRKTIIGFLQLLKKKITVFLRQKDFIACRVIVWNSLSDSVSFTSLSSFKGPFY